MSRSILKAIYITNRSSVGQRIEEMLKSEGIAAVQAEDCQAAWDIIQHENDSTLIVIDWNIGAAQAALLMQRCSDPVKPGSRPLMLIVSKKDPDVVAIATEYGVTQIISADGGQGDYGSRLQQLIRDESDPNQIQKNLRTVVAARASGDWKLSISLLEDLLLKSPDHPVLICELAYSLMHEGHLKPAKDHLQKLFKRLPSYLRGSYLYGRCLMLIGDTDQAIKIMTQAKVINPYDTKRLVDLGQSLLKRNQIREARGNFEEVSKIDYKNLDATIGRSNCYFAEGNANQALKVLREFSSPLDVASVFNTAALVSVRQGRYSDAINLYKEALKSIESNAAVLVRNQVIAKLNFNIGLGYVRWEKVEDSVPYFEKAISLDETFEKARRVLKRIKDSQSSGANMDEETFE